VAGHDPDDDAPGPVPDPLDRLWLHPSELARKPGAATAVPADRRRSKRDWALMAGAGAAGALVTVLVLLLSGAVDRTPDKVTTVRTVSKSQTSELTTKLASAVGPAVVGVVAAGPTGERRGSGVVFRSGYVLTSDDLIGDATTVTIFVGTGSGAPATVVGRDPVTAVAVLRSDSATKVAALSNGPSVRVGQIVVEIAAPDDARHWVSAGVVSSVGMLAKSSGGQVLAGLIETDADGAPAGSALVDRNGDVVGMVAAQDDQQRSVAMPVSTIAPVANELILHGKASHGWMGVAAVDAPDGTHPGASIAQITPGSPAERAKLQNGDVITSVDGTTITGMGALLDTVRRHHPGDRVEVTIVRGDAQRRLWVVLGDHAAGI
ncbi:MAG TPA: S1C family serine protease, partial [Acidimicrobiales bacterium]|nr:S1C family serine protease [Acidimicrobiales bacterium]